MMFAGLKGARKGGTIVERARGDDAFDKQMHIRKGRFIINNCIDLIRSLILNSKLSCTVPDHAYDCATSFASDPYGKY